MGVAPPAEFPQRSIFRGGFPLRASSFLQQSKAADWRAYSKPSEAWGFLGGRAYRRGWGYRHRPLLRGSGPARRREGPAERGLLRAPLTATLCGGRVGSFPRGRISVLGAGPEASGPLFPWAGRPKTGRVSSPEGRAWRRRPLLPRRACLAAAAARGEPAAPQPSQTGSGSAQWPAGAEAGGGGSVRAAGLLSRGAGARAPRLLLDSALRPRPAPLRAGPLFAKASSSDPARGVDLTGPLPPRLILSPP